MYADVTISLILMRLAAMFVIAAVQGAVTAGTVVLLGDNGPKYDGRLTLLPFRHIDLVGAACAVIFGLGWTRPLTVDGTQIRSGRFGIILVVFSGFVALLATAVALLALVVPAIEVLPYAAGITAAATLRVAAKLCVWMALFNLLPVPPLTAGYLFAVLGVRLSDRARMVLTTCVVLTVVLGVARSVIAPAYDVIAPLLLGAALTGG